MAQLFNLGLDDDRFASLANGEVQMTPLFEGGGWRARLLVTRSGSWPMHTDEEREIYVVLRGEVAYQIGGDVNQEVRVRAGQLIAFAPHEPHGARIERGAISIRFDYAGEQTQDDRS